MPTSRSPAAGSERARSVRGFSLLELIIVMMILAVLFGIGLGAFKRLARPDRMALSAITEAVRSASLFARGEGAPATVTLLPERNEVTSHGLRTVGTWHFEDDVGTGWPLSAVHDPGSLVRDGVIGSALQLGGGSPLSLPTPPPSFDSPHGFGVDVYLRPRANPRPLVLLERAGLWSLRLVDAETLEATVQIRVEDRVEELRHMVTGATFPPEVFTRLTVLFDGRTLSIRVNGARAGDDLLLGHTRLLAMNPRVALTSGQPPEAFQGELDELRVLSVVAGTPALLPDEVTLEGVERTLHLDARGRLDPAFHRTPVTIAITHDDPPRSSGVEVGLLGNVVTRDRLSEDGP